MAILLIIALVIALVAVVFAVQNAVPVTVVFLQFQFQSSLALVLLLSFAAGVLVGLVGLAPTFIKRRVEITRLKKRLQQMEKSPGGAGSETDTGEETPLPPLA